ncbi:hypothetical protein L3Q82_015040 [Scortum barcoo]|uniref:Uncharacterized protein n=1 Tax=Scortum barcoo TaxID=214431 RepID=A0ACB8VT35_9TELE|nr:hypothetical protein L3Q82_015040 [Scortum barcoo]
MFAFVGPLHSATMKFSLIAAVVVLALAQGSFAQDATDLQKLGQYFEEMKNKMTQDLMELMGNQDLANQAQTFIEDRRAQLEPLATQVQEQLKTVAVNMEEQIKPLAASMQAQMQPMIETFQREMEAILQKMTQKSVQN